MGKVTRIAYSKAVKAGINLTLKGVSLNDAVKELYKVIPYSFYAETACKQALALIEFSTGLVLGLISELLLVDVISLKNEEIDSRGSIILNIIFNKIEQVLQEAVGGLIYRSSSRSKKAKILLENLKKTMKSVRLYSSISDITLIEQIARLDAIVRLINKLVDMSLCNTIESISSR